MTDRLDEIKDRWSLDSSLPRPVPWGFDDVVWLVDEIVRLRAEAKRADDEATTLANSDLATTEQVVRALRAENERLREALTDIARGDSERAIKAEKARDEVGIQLAAAQERLRLARMAVVGDVDRLLKRLDALGFFVGDIRHEEVNLRRSRAALDAVPGDALAGKKEGE
jgi:hypothetical protein